MARRITRLSRTHVPTDLSHTQAAARIAQSSIDNLRLSDVITDHYQDWQKLLRLTARVFNLGATMSEADVEVIQNRHRAQLSKSLLTEIITLSDHHSEIQVLEMQAAFSMGIEFGRGGLRAAVRR